MKCSASDYIKNANYVSHYGLDTLKLLNPQNNEVILDLGCGEGELAEKIYLKASNVIAIDSNKSMVNAAKKRGLTALVGSAEKITFNNQFDAVFSNAALHWMKPADVVIKNVFNSLKKEGRFCAEMGGYGNVQTIIDQIYCQLAYLGLKGEDYNPWYFPSKNEYKLKLEQAGFQVEYIEQFERPTKLPTDIAGWLRTFANSFLQDIPQSQHEDFIQSVKNGLSDTLKSKSGDWYADYIRLRFKATKATN